MSILPAARLLGLLPCGSGVNRVSTDDAVADQLERDVLGEVMRRMVSLPPDSLNVPDPAAVALAAGVLVGPDLVPTRGVLPVGSGPSAVGGGDGVLIPSALRPAVFVTPHA